MQQFQVPNAKRGPFKYEDGKFFMDSLLALTAYESDSYVVKKVDRSIVKNPLGCSFVHWGQNHFEARAKAILRELFAASNDEKAAQRQGSRESTAS